MEERNSGIEDIATLEQAKVKRLHVEKRLSAFTAFDPSLDNAWLTIWQNEIKAFEIKDNDETYMDQMTIYTAEIKSETEKCLKALRDLRYYAGLAFGKRARYKSFGFNRMTRVAQSTPAFLVFMKVNHRLAISVQAQLIAKGMTAPQIDNINTVATALAEAELLQEQHKRNRLTATEERVESINRLWEFMSRASRAADVIFADDETVRALFYLPERTKKAKKKPEEEPE